MAIKKTSILSLMGIVIAGIAIGGTVLLVLNNGTEKVIVPTTEIKAGDTFTSDNIKTVDISKNAVLNGITITDASKIIGKTAVSKISPGEMITTSRVTDTKGDGYIANMQNPDTDFAVQIPIADSNPIKGISVGDYVSIMGSITNSNSESGTGKIGDKNFKVVGIATNDNSVITGITIEVGPDCVAKISHAVLNNKILVTFVSSDQKQETINGTTQTQLYQDLTNQAATK